MSSVEKALVGRDEKRAPLKMPAWEASKGQDQEYFLLPKISMILKVPAGRHFDSSFSPNQNSKFRINPISKCVSGEPKSKAGKVLNEFENFKGFWNSPGGERKTDTNHCRLLTNGTELTVFTYIPLP